MQDRGSHQQPGENGSKKTKNMRTVPNSLSNSERLQSKMQLNSEKLESQIKELNQKGLRAKEACDYGQALSYFQECERLLEMGADCGKSIDRELILIVLSNEAFAYHQLDKLQNAKKYLEAAIYNIGQFLDDCNQLALEQEIAKYAEDKRTHEEQTHFFKAQIHRISTLLIRKKELVVAQMQYAQLLAQGRQHELAVQTAEKAIHSFVKYCCILGQYKILNRAKADSKLCLLEELLTFPQHFAGENIQSLTLLIRQASNKESTFSYLNASLVEQKLFNELKIQNFLAIKPKSFKDHTINLFNIMDLEKLSSSHLMDLVILMVYICLHFIIGAQSLEFSRAKEQLQKDKLYILEEEGLQQKESQFRNKKAQKHHLFSLLLALKYLPRESELLSELKQIYKSAFEKHYQTLWNIKHQSEEQFQQMQVMNIEFSANLSTRLNAQAGKAQEHGKQKEMFSLKVPNTTKDRFLLDMPSIDSIQCLSVNSSMVNISYNQGNPAQESQNKIQPESYFKNPNKSTKYNPLFMGTWDLRQLQKLNKPPKVDQKSENTQQTCEKTIQKESKEIKNVQGSEQKQVFQIIIHKKQKVMSPLKSQEVKQTLDAQKLKILKTEANSLNEQSVKKKNTSKRKLVKNPEFGRQKSKSKNHFLGSIKHEKHQLKIPDIKVKFNNAKSPPLDPQKKAKNFSKDTKLKKTTKSKSKNKPVSNQHKIKSLNKKNVSPPKNAAAKLDSIYYQKK